MARPGYLIVTKGRQAGRRFELEPAGDNQLGRDADLAVSLDDPLCSRVHAVVRLQGDQWQISDQGSLNGTYVNGQKTDDAALGDGHLVRVGSTELEFRHGASDSGQIRETVADVAQMLVKDAEVNPHDTGVFAEAAVQGSQQTRDLLLLYQLSISLLGTSDAHEVIRLALDLLRDGIGADVVGFLWIRDDGRLEPNLVVPEEARDQVRLSDALTNLVLEDGKAIWVAKQADEDAELESFADALCVPLVHDGKIVGAIHVYSEQSRFQQTQFEFAISLANIAAVALVRARHDEQLEQENARLKEQSGGFGEIVGDCPPIQKLKKNIERLARAGGSILIRGESGVGKELVARALHQASPRADRPLVAVNCAAIPETLIESQLFGHKAGAFTGADRDHIGWFQQADMGTLFLDEVGELTLPAQAKLLRVLEGQTLIPVGDVEEVQVDVRVIAATNQDLAELVREKKYREDLYYRLSVFELHVPPLRERGEDLNRLIDLFLDHFRHQHGRADLALSAEAREKLCAYSWPGNVRQLRNVLDSAVVLALGEAIETTDLGLRDTGTGELESLRFDFWEQRLIREALTKTDNSVPAAAKLLGIGRATLYRKIEEYGIPR